MSTDIDSILIKYPLPTYDEEEFECDLCTLAKVTGIPTIVIEGTTPSFNDGDICRHSEHIFDADQKWSLKDSDGLEPLRALAHVREALYGTNYRITLVTNVEGETTFDIDEFNPEW